MKVTMYELLGLVKDGKAPKKIKFKNVIYEYKNNIEDGFIDYVGIEKETNVNFYLSSYIGSNYINDIFTDEVEIIEEDKKIEKLNLPSFEEFETMNVAEQYVATAKEYDVLNELIDEINNLKEK